MRKKLRLINKKMKFFYIGFFGAVMAVVMMYLSNEIAMLFGKENQWDSMAFVGALFGGALTLIGVQMTLKHHFSMDYRKEAAYKKKAADEVVKITNAFALGLKYSDDRSPGIRTACEHLKQNEEKLLLNATMVSREVYKLARTLMFNGLVLAEYLEDTDLPSEFEEARIRLFSEKKKKIAECLDDIKTEIDKEESEYRMYQSENS